MLLVKLKHILKAIKFINSDCIYIFSAILISLFLTAPYQAFISDHNYYIPTIVSNINQIPQNSLDLISSFTQTKYTLFDELIILMNKLGIGIGISLFILSVTSWFSFFVGIRGITRYVF